MLSNIVLDQLDKELEQRGLRFVRYSDDCVIYVRSKQAAERVMQSVSRYITRKLRLKVNPDKNEGAGAAVGQPKWRQKPSASNRPAQLISKGLVELLR